jgi:hypothetical protein
MGDTPGWGDIPVLVKPFEFDKRSMLSELLLSFVTAYFLGMLARYFPSGWVALVSTGPGDRLRPLLMAAMEDVEESFPRLILNSLTSRYHGRH